MAVPGGKHNARGDGDQVGRGLARGRIVGQWRGGLGKDGAGQDRVGVGWILDNAVFGTRIQLPDDGLGKSKFRVEGLGARREHRHGKRADSGRNMRGCTHGVVAAAGESERGE